MLSTRSTPMPIDLDKRRVETCARVTGANTKVGKAQKLETRRRDYCKKTFKQASGCRGRQFSFATTKRKLSRLESELHTRIWAYRSENCPSGPRKVTRTREWYSTLAFEEACKIVTDFLRDKNIEPSVSDWCGPGGQP